MEFGIDDIKKAMSDLSSNASPRSDGVPSILLQECRHSMVEELYLLWKESIRLERITTKLKEATITLIYKGEGKESVKNYCSDSLTFHIIKVFEKMVAEKLDLFLRGKGR